MTAERPCIMVVDDQPANLCLLEDMLEEDYRVRSFPRGRLAVAAAAQEAPDLILLDINMPEMKGFEVCEKIKSNPDLADIPVVFLSALGDTEDKVKAFQSGAVDYITKPFQLEEVHSRVRTHLELHRARRALREQNDHLEELVRARTRELAQAHQRLQTLDRAKSDFLKLISHEFRTPLNGLLGVGELLFSECPGGSGELREMFDHSRQRILSILDHAMLLTQIEVEAEKFAPQPVPLQELLSALSRRAGVAVSDNPVQDTVVQGRKELLLHALDALVDTSVSLSGPGERVLLGCHILPETIEVTATSRGYRLPESALPRFFDLLSVSEAVAPGAALGLGPPTAARILALFGATVAVSNCDPPGITITVSLRRAA
jgi:two-component system sensor histidine kinase/response regulator